LADSLVSTYSDLIAHISANLPAGYTDNDVYLPNDDREAPKDANWIRVDITNNNTIDAAAGAGWRRTFGIITLEINTPKGSTFGVKTAIDHAELLQRAWRKQQMSNTRTTESSVIFTGNNDAWYTIQIQTEYYFEG